MEYYILVGYNIHPQGSVIYWILTQEGLEDPDNTDDFVMVSRQHRTLVYNNNEYTMLRMDVQGSYGWSKDVKVHHEWHVRKAWEELDNLLCYVAITNKNITL